MIFVISIGLVIIALSILCFYFKKKNIYKKLMVIILIAIGLLISITIFIIFYEGWRCLLEPYSNTCIYKHAPPLPPDMVY